MKNKTYIVNLFDYDPQYDEFEVAAKNKKEALRKARKIIATQAEYSGMEIDSIGVIDEK